MAAATPPVPPVLPPAEGSDRHINERHVDQTLGRERRLRYARHLRLLFERGQRLRQGPLQLVYLQPGPEDLPISQRADAPVPSFGILAAFSAPKRAHRRATQRTRVRRLLREAYRRQVLPQLRTAGVGPLWLYWMWTAPARSKHADRKDADQAPLTQAEVADTMRQLCARLVSRLPAAAPPKSPQP